MGKNILERVAGYLRDLAAGGKDVPPSAGGSGDGRRPDLAAIEGGRGRAEEDGGEREKPCAVIGIPYSSEAAEPAEEEGVEGKGEAGAGNRMKKRMCCAGASVADALAPAPGRLKHRNGKSVIEGSGDR